MIISLKKKLSSIVFCMSAGLFCVQIAGAAAAVNLDEFVGTPSDLESKEDQVESKIIWLKRGDQKRAFDKQLIDLSGRLKSLIDFAIENDPDKGDTQETAIDITIPASSKKEVEDRVSGVKRSAIDKNSIKMFIEALKQNNPGSFALRQRRKTLQLISFKTVSLDKLHEMLSLALQISERKNQREALGLEAMRLSELLILGNFAYDLNIPAVLDEVTTVLVDKIQDFLAKNPDFTADQEIPSGSSLGLNQDYEKFIASNVIRFKHDKNIDLSGGCQALFSPDGTKIIAAIRAFGIKTFDAATGQELKSINDVKIQSLMALSADGTTVAVKAFGEGIEQKIKIFNIQTGQELLTLLVQFKQGPYALALNPDGTKLIAQMKGDIKVFNVETGEELLTIDGDSNSSPFSKMKLSFDGKKIIVMQKLAIKIFSIDTGLEIQTIGTGSLVGWGLTLSPDGNNIAVIGNDDFGWGSECINIFNLVNPEKVLQIRSRGFSSPLAEVSWDNDSTKVVGILNSDTLKVFDAKTAKTLYQMPLASRDGAISSVVWSSDGTKIIVMGAKKIQIYRRVDISLVVSVLYTMFESEMARD